MLPWWLASCTPLKLRDNAQTYYAATVLAGRVAAPADWRGPVIVAALAERAEGPPQVAHQVLLHEPGGYELMVADGRYHVVAFGDLDGNGRPDATEPAASLAAPIDVKGEGLALQLDMTLAPGTPLGHLWPAAAPAAPRHSTQVGAPLVWDGEAFSAEAGRQGYWAPLEVFLRQGGNVYFAEPYDATRTPVLFVHGAAGSAQDWRAFIERLDRRYQAWVFQYPSGAALDAMAHLLYWKVYNLQWRYRFERLHIVAHSMGGLVVRRMLLNHAAELQPRLGGFVSLSTPWGGDNLAPLGVKHSPAVVPSWRDMQPGQAFLTSLFERPLPSSVQHMLLFGHRGSYDLLRSNTDGVVALRSQLQPQAQAEAKVVTGFDEDHTSILGSPAVLAHVQGLLAQVDRAGSVAAGSRVQVRVAPAQAGAADGLASALPSLLLRPLEGDQPAAALQWLPLSPGAGTAMVGPIPAGRYEASVVAPGFRSQPVRQRITLLADGELVLDFSLAPQGALFGQVGVATDPIALPPGGYRAPQPDVPVRRIVLQGPGGGTRELVPRHGSARPDLVNAFLDGRDDADGALFSFVGLDGGEYVLTVEAEGYAPHVSRHHVKVGQVTPTANVLLRR